MKTARKQALLQVSIMILVRLVKSKFRNEFDSNEKVSFVKSLDLCVRFI